MYISENGEADLFLFMGQSNMAGRGITCPQFSEKAPKCLKGAGYEFRAISDPTKLYPIAEPFGEYENKPDGIYEPGRKSGSLVTAFVNAYYAEIHIPVIAVSASKGGSSVSEWLPGSPFLKDAIQRFRDAVCFLDSHHKMIRHKYMVWCQGETDGKHQTEPDLYKSSFLQIWKTLAFEGIEHCFLIRIGNYNADAADADAPLQDYSMIMHAQDELAEEQSYITMVSTKFGEMLGRGLMRDTYHYYQQAYNEVGTDAGAHTADFVKSL